MVALLLQKYDLQDPFIDEYGVFADSSIQTLYTSLVNTGSESLAKGIFIGCTIEDLDIYDLEELMAVADNEDIRTVYQNLMKGSRNHLRSFSSLYNMKGETYTAEYIAPEELDQILSTESEKGFVDANGNPFTPTGVETLDNLTLSVPDNFIVAQNYPNPFNPQTTIQFTLPNMANVSISVKCKKTVTCCKVGYRLGKNLKKT